MLAFERAFRHDALVLKFSRHKAVCHDPHIKEKRVRQATAAVDRTGASGEVTREERVPLGAVWAKLSALNPNHPW
jgi:hypothetical protein